MAGPWEKYQAKSPWEKYAKKKPRTWGETLHENFIGSGEADTIGERAGQAINRGGEVVIDTGKAVASGIGEGLMGLLTLPQTAGGLLDAGMEKAFGIEPPQSVLPDSAGIARQAYQETLGYTPETAAGEYGRTVGNFLPGMMMGGTAPQMVAAGLASEAAGQVTEGTTAEPWARFGAGMAGGLAMGALESRFARLAAQKDFVAKNSETKPLLDAARAKYEEGHALGLKVKPNATQGLEAKLRGIAQDAGLITPKGKVIENPDIRQALALLEDFGTAPVSTRQLQSLRKMIGSVAGSKDPNISRVGVLMKREYDDFLGQFAPQFKEGNALNRRAMLGEMMDRSEDLAENRAGAYTQSGSENALRAEFRQLDKDIIRGKTRGLRPDQKQAIKDVAHGTGGLNLMRGMGRMAPRGPISMGFHGFPFMIGNAIGGPTLGGIFAGGTMTAGAASQGLATLMQRVNAARAAATMRAPEAMILPKTNLPVTGLAAMGLSSPR